MAALVMYDGFVSEVHPKGAQFIASELSTIAHRWFACVSVRDKVFVCSDDTDAKKEPVNLVVTRVARQLGCSRLFRGNVLICKKSDLRI